MIMLVFRLWQARRVYFALATSLLLPTIADAVVSPSSADRSNSTTTLDVELAVWEEKLSLLRQQESDLELLLRESQSGQDPSAGGEGGLSALLEETIRRAPTFIYRRDEDADDDLPLTALHDWHPKPHRLRDCAPPASNASTSAFFKIGLRTILRECGVAGKQFEPVPLGKLLQGGTELNLVGSLSGIAAANGSSEHDAPELRRSTAAATTMHIDFWPCEDQHWRRFVRQGTLRIVLTEKNRLCVFRSKRRLVSYDLNALLVDATSRSTSSDVQHHASEQLTSKFEFGFSESDLALLVFYGMTHFASVEIGENHETEVGPLEFRRILVGGRGDDRLEESTQTCQSGIKRGGGGPESAGDAGLNGTLSEDCGGSFVNATSEDEKPEELSTGPSADDPKSSEPFRFIEGSPNLVWQGSCLFRIGSQSEEVPVTDLASLFAVLFALPQKSALLASLQNLATARSMDDFNAAFTIVAQEARQSWDEFSTTTSAYFDAAAAYIAAAARYLYWFVGFFAQGLWHGITDKRGFWGSMLHSREVKAVLGLAAKGFGVQDILVNGTSTERPKTSSTKPQPPNTSSAGESAPPAPPPSSDEPENFGSQQTLDSSVETSLPGAAQPVFLAADDSLDASSATPHVQKLYCFDDDVVAVRHLGVRDRYFAVLRDQGRIATFVVRQRGGGSDFLQTSEGFLVSAEDAGEDHVVRSAEIVPVADEQGAADGLGPFVFVFAGLARKDDEPGAPVRQHVSLLDTQDLWSLASALPSAAAAQQDPPDPLLWTARLTGMHSPLLFEQPEGRFVSAIMNAKQNETFAHYFHVRAIPPLDRNKIRRSLVGQFLHNYDTEILLALAAIYVLFVYARLCMRAQPPVVNPEVWRDKRWEDPGNVRMLYNSIMESVRESEGNSPTQFDLFGNPISNGLDQAAMGIGGSGVHGAGMFGFPSKSSALGTSLAPPGGGMYGGKAAAYMPPPGGASRYRQAQAGRGYAGGGTSPNPGGGGRF